MNLWSILKRAATKSEIPLASGEGRLLHYEVQNALAKPMAYADVQLKPPSDVIVHDVFTEPPARGQGLATSLLQKIQEEHPRSSQWLASTSPEMDSVAQKTGFSLESQKGLNRTLPKEVPSEVSYSNANVWKRTVSAMAGAGVLASSNSEASTGKTSKFNISDVRANVPVADGPGPLGRVEDILPSFWKGLSGKMEPTRGVIPAAATVLGHMGWETVVNPVKEISEVTGKVRRGEPMNVEDYGKVFNGVFMLSPRLR